MCVTLYHNCVGQLGDSSLPHRINSGGNWWHSAEDGFVSWVFHTSGTLAEADGRLGSADTLTWSVYLGPL